MTNSNTFSTTTIITPGGAPAAEPLKARSPILRHIRAVLITGLISAIPLFITVSILAILYGQVTKFTQPPADWIADQLLSPLAGHWISPENLRWVTTPFLAILISLLLVYILGLLGTFFIGRKTLAHLEHFISNLPLIKGIYGTTKQVMAVFRQGGGGAGFQRVVLVQFPRLGTWTVAFVTNSVHDVATNQTLVCCFIPMTPNPTSGFFQMFPEPDVRNTDWTVDMGIKIVLSGGLLAPPRLDVAHLPTTPTAVPVVSQTEP
jgi:uncharacterized membrane protein